MTLEDYKTALTSALNEVERLREENNQFRLMLLSSPSEPNGIFLAQMRNHWAARDPEECMLMMELHEAHSKIFAELVHSKLSKTQIKEAINKREAAKLEKARSYRETKNKPSEERYESKILTSQDAARAKAVKALAKTLKITYAEAEKHVDAMSGKTFAKA